MFLDFCKAFDSVVHSKLIYSIQKYGFSDVLCNWLRSFLTNRYLCVQLDGTSSPWAPIVSGINLGTVVGPFLFNIYVNDLPDCVSFVEVVMYANDVRLSISGNCTATCDQLVSDIVTVSN